MTNPTPTPETVTIYTGTTHDRLDLFLSTTGWATVGYADELAALAAVGAPVGIYTDGGHYAAAVVFNGDNVHVIDDMTGSWFVRTYLPAAAEPDGPRWAEWTTMACIDFGQVVRRMTLAVTLAAAERDRA